MTKRTTAKKPPKPKTYTQQETAIMGALIAHKVEQGMNAFIVAGAEVLRGEYRFTPEQCKDWATLTVQLGTKYLRLNNGNDPDLQNAISNQ